MASQTSPRELVECEATIIFNVSVYDDVDDVIRSFLRRRTNKIKIVDAKAFFIAAWGPDWNGYKDNGQPKSTDGLLNIIEFAFPGKTQYKPPTITNSNWMKKYWSPRQSRYSLEDVVFITRAGRAELKQMPTHLLDAIIYLFPFRELGVKEQESLERYLGEIRNRTDGTHYRGN